MSVCLCVCVSVCLCECECVGVWVCGCVGVWNGGCRGCQEGKMGKQVSASNVGMRISLSLRNARKSERDV